MSTGNLNTQTHRLTDLTGEKHPYVCQKCGGSNRPTFGNGLMRTNVERWQEHDHHDKPVQKIVVLCTKCAKAIIEPHPRLYNKLGKNQPWPGCMEICVDCPLRSGVSCTSPDAKANGGLGVMITIMPPFYGFVDGPKYSGPFVEYPSPASACKQKPIAV